MNGASTAAATSILRSEAEKTGKCAAMIFETGVEDPKIAMPANRKSGVSGETDRWM
jgi:hypothetical protein